MAEGQETSTGPKVVDLPVPKKKQNFFSQLLQLYSDAEDELREETADTSDDSRTSSMSNESTPPYMRMTSPDDIGVSFNRSDRKLHVGVGGFDTTMGRDDGLDRNYTSRGPKCRANFMHIARISKNIIPPLADVSFDKKLLEYITSDAQLTCANRKVKLGKKRTKRNQTSQYAAYRTPPTVKIRVPYITDGQSLLRKIKSAPRLSLDNTPYKRHKSTRVKSPACPSFPLAWKYNRRWQKKCNPDAKKCNPEVAKQRALDAKLSGVSTVKPKRSTSKHAARKLQENAADSKVSFSTSTHRRDNRKKSKSPEKSISDVTLASTVHDTASEPPTDRRSDDDQTQSRSRSPHERNKWHGKQINRKIPKTVLSPLTHHTKRKTAKFGNEESKTPTSAKSRHKKGKDKSEAVEQTISRDSPKTMSKIPQNRRRSQDRETVQDSRRKMRTPSPPRRSITNNELMKTRRSVVNTPEAPRKSQTYRRSPAKHQSVETQSPRENPRVTSKKETMQKKAPVRPSVLSRLSDKAECNMSDETTLNPNMVLPTIRITAPSPVPSNIVIPSCSDTCISSSTSTTSLGRASSRQLVDSIDQACEKNGTTIKEGGSSTMKDKEDDDGIAVESDEENSFSDDDADFSQIKPNISVVKTDTDKGKVEKSPQAPDGGAHIVSTHRAMTLRCSTPVAVSTCSRSKSVEISPRQNRKKPSMPIVGALRNARKDLASRSQSFDRPSTPDDRQSCSPDTRSPDIQTREIHILKTSPKRLNRGKRETTPDDRRQLYSSERQTCSPSPMSPSIQTREIHIRKTSPKRLNRGKRETQYPKAKPNEKVVNAAPRKVMPKTAADATSSVAMGVTTSADVSRKPARLSSIVTNAEVKGNKPTSASSCKSYTKFSPKTSTRKHLKTPVFKSNKTLEADLSDRHHLSKREKDVSGNAIPKDYRRRAAGQIRPVLSMGRTSPVLPVESPALSLRPSPVLSVGSPALSLRPSPVLPVGSPALSLRPSPVLPVGSPALSLRPSPVLSVERQSPALSLTPISATGENQEFPRPGSSSLITTSCDSLVMTTSFDKLPPISSRMCDVVCANVDGEHKEPSVATEVAEDQDAE